MNDLLRPLFNLLPGMWDRRWVGLLTAWIIMVLGGVGVAMFHERYMASARVYVDTRAGALKEGGDIVQPLVNDTIDEDDVIGDLFELARGQQTGRLPGDTTSITLFKSVGAALEDLAAAELAIEA